MRSGVSATSLYEQFVDALSPRYMVSRELGRGGMATVYLATDTRHNRPVAVKVLRLELAGTINTQRFLREIQIVSQLNHPNILPLYDSGEAAGRLYFVTPFVEGRTLRDLLDQMRVLPHEQAVEIGRKAGDALQYAHERGVIHRDIKPENILISAGQPIVADFGIARAMHEASSERLTSDDLAIGTRAYMSPEQGTPRAVVDARSDIYSLGVVLYEMLTGTLPEARTSGKSDARSPIRQARRKTGGDAIPSHVETAIRRSLAVDPDRRFSSAKEFAESLAGPRRKRRRMFAGAALTAIGVAVGIVVGQAIYRRIPARNASVVLSPGRLVVVPLANNTSSRDLDYLGLMAADWITEGLQRTGVADVVPTPTALQAARFVESQRARDPAADPVRMLANETGASVVVTGSYYREGNQLQLQVQVTDARTAKLIGAVGPVHGSITAATAAVEQLRSRTMTVLAMKVDDRLASAAAAPAQPPTFEAYREFTEGLESYVGTNYAAAAAKFEAAFRRDTLLVTALLMESIAVSNMGEYARADSLLNRLSSRRTQLSPYDARWFDYRQRFLQGDRPGALRSVRSIAASVPGTKATFNLAVEALQNGYLAEAERAIRSLSPDRGPMRGWALYWDVLSRIEHLRGEYATELSDGRRAQTAFPERSFVLLVLVRALAAKGDVRGVSATLDTAERLPPDPLAIGPAELALEAGWEFVAHGHDAAAPPILERGLRWVTRPAGGIRPTTSERWTRARLLYALHRWEQARDSAAQLLRDSQRNAEYLGLEGVAAARVSDLTTVRRVNAALDSMPRRYAMGIPTFAQARIASVLGRTDDAMRLLQQSMSEGHEYDLWTHREADFDPLRATPAFRAIVQPKGR